MTSGRNGAGIAFLFGAIIQDELASGGLAPLLDDWSPAFFGLYRYHASHRHFCPPLRAFIDWMGQSQAV